MGDKSKQGTIARIENKGLLELKLKNPDGSALNSFFVKQYPKGVDAWVISGVGEISGSGFLIDKKGHAVTNYHVIRDRTSITVIFPSSNKHYDADLLIKDNSNDLAVLKLKEFAYDKDFDKDLPFSLDKGKETKAGENVFTLGFPLGEILGQSVKVSSGIINSVYGFSDDPRLLQISNPIQPGNSGSPLFNERGELIGVVVSSVDVRFFYESAATLPQNVNYAIKVSYLSSLISMLPNSDDILKRKSDLEGITLKEKVERLSPYMVLVKSTNE